MKTKRPYTKRIAARSANEQLLKDCHDVMTDAINDWETPDSPEAFCWSMKGLMVLRDRIAARLGLASESQRKTAGLADGKPEGQAENAKSVPPAEMKLTTGNK
jgi:hypothetical protein